MEVIDFAPFARRRRGGEARSFESLAAMPAVVGDRWAALHTQGTDAEIAIFEDERPDFWADLQFRLAYPTHRLRAH